MDKPRGHYVKSNKLEKEKYHIISFLYGIIINKLIETEENRFVGARDRGQEVGEKNKLVLVGRFSLNKWICF